MSRSAVIPIIRADVRSCAAAAALMLMPLGCGGPESPSAESGAASDGGAGTAPWFEETACDVGIEFAHASGHQERHFMPEIMAGGVAIVDINNDGWMDAYFVQSGRIGAPEAEQPANQLFRNRGDGSFENITEGSGAEDRRYGLGVAAGDVNNDGFVDLYITNHGRNTLLRNSGDETFTDVTETAGVGDTGLSTSAAFVDLNLSGWLDLFVLNYVVWSPASEITCYNVSGQPDYCIPTSYNTPAPDVLYRNEGDGTFRDVSAAAGLRSAFGNGLGVICLDMNLDGLTDVFVANDKMSNQLWQNETDDGAEIKLRDVAMTAGCAVDQFGEAKAGMGVAATDLFGNGYEDLIVVNLQSESDSLYRNMGGYFLDETTGAGLSTISRPFTRFGLGAIDFDNNGRVDLFQANGAVFRRREGERFTDDPYAEPNLLLRGLENGRFEEVLPRGGTQPTLLATSRAAAFGDLDNDGGVDILIVNRDGPAHLLRNIVPHRGRWISVRVLDQHGRDAYHARIQITVDDHGEGTGGSRIITREVRSTYSYLAANDPRLHIGLGDHERLRMISVTWPGGEREEFDGVRHGRFVTIERGAGGSIEQAAAGESQP